jgi:hypothetical protein
MNVTPERLDTIFGPQWSEPGLFYAYELALRFELAKGSHQIDRFLTAHKRAAAVTSHVLGDANDLTLVVLLFADSDKPGVSGLLRLFRGLEACGLPTPGRQSVRAKRAGQSDYETAVVLELTAPMGKEHIPRVLWAAIGNDLGIHPKVPARLCITSISRGVLLNPYDDRGMDVVGTTVDCLRSAYERFGDWLLSHDLSKMTRAFGC